MKTFVSLVLVIVVATTLGCQQPAEPLMVVSAAEFLESFDHASFDSASQACGVIDNAAGSKQSISFIDVKWSLAAAMGKHRYADFLAKYYQQQDIDFASTHYIDCTPLSSDYSCLTDLPGWNKDPGLIHANGEVVWMENGRVIHVQEIAYGSPDDVLAKTLELFH